MNEDRLPEAIIPQIIIIGHSLGGIVARNTFLLSNHPSSPASAEIISSNPGGSEHLTVDDIHWAPIWTNKCPVSDIIMLSSPNQR